MRRFYAPRENFRDKTVTLNLEETRHLRDVLRLREGSRARVFDGEGREFSCEIKIIKKKESVLEILEETALAAPPSNLNLTLAAALLKGEKFDLVVQKATELGVAGFVPLEIKRAEVKLKGAEKKVERWRKIALEAAKQSGRAMLMKIENPVDFSDFIETADGARILFSERGGERFSVVKPAEKITALIGAEGGWEDAEIEAARERGFQIVTLKGRILRAETAAIAVCAVLQHRFGDFN